MKTETSEHAKGRSLPVPMLAPDVAHSEIPSAPSRHTPPAEPVLTREGSVEMTATAEPAQAMDQIEERAYFLYLARNGGEGDALSDWLEAERQVRQEQSVQR